jgi:hypothetical protein
MSRQAAGRSLPATWLELLLLLLGKAMLIDVSQISSV